MSNWEETQDTLERLYLPGGPGMPWEPPGGVEGSCWGGKGTCHIYLACCHSELVPDKLLENGWMDGLLEVSCAEALITQTTERYNHNRNFYIYHYGLQCNVVCN